MSKNAALKIVPFIDNTDLTAKPNLEVEEAAEVLLSATIGIMGMDPLLAMEAFLHAFADIAVHQHGHILNDNDNAKQRIGVLLDHMREKHASCIESIEEEEALKSSH